jgi:hypothetical protein
MPAIVRSGTSVDETYLRFGVKTSSASRVGPPTSDGNGRTRQVFAGSIPEPYDTYLASPIFEARGHHLAERIVAPSPSVVLEMAAGSGVVSLALAPRLGPRVRYIVTERNQPTLDDARSRQRVVDRNTWQQADTLDLPFENESCHAIGRPFGVTPFVDKVAESA